MSQKTTIIKELNLNGKVSRNWCLDRRITRLGAIICLLNKEGWNLTGKWEGNDYVYSKFNEKQAIHAKRPVEPIWKTKQREEALREENSKQANLFN